MRKIAREAVIFCVLGAVIGSGYFLVQQYRSFRESASLLETTEREAREAEGEMHSLPQQLDARVLLGQFLEEAAIGFAAGLAVWGTYRLVRFAIRG
jgi:hypothetical protein